MKELKKFLSELVYARPLSNTLIYVRDASKPDAIGMELIDRDEVLHDIRYN